MDLVKEIPDNVYLLDKEGCFRQPKQEELRLQTSQYWANKSQQIGLVMLISTIVLMIMLIVETEIFEFLWGLIWGVV